MGVVIGTRFNVQATLIIAWTANNHITLSLLVMGSSDVKNTALAPLKTFLIMTTKPSHLAVVMGAVFAGKGMGPNSTTSNAHTFFSKIPG